MIGLKEAEIRTPGVMTEETFSAANAYNTMHFPSPLEETLLNKRVSYKDIILKPEKVLTDSKDPDRISRNDLAYARYYMAYYVGDFFMTGANPDAEKDLSPLGVPKELGEILENHGMTIPGCFAIDEAQLKEYKFTNEQISILKGCLSAFLGNMLKAKYEPILE
ncbi:MAG TPA: hypothetical protein VMR41_04215 [Patescibacteria group bacterium]|nr:hypothetical protein [Patescibacteria group bacterium]